MPILDATLPLCCLWIPEWVCNYFYYGWSYLLDYNLCT